MSVSPDKDKYLGQVDVNNVINPVTVKPVDVNKITDPVTINGTVTVGNNVNVNVINLSLTERGKLFSIGHYVDQSDKQSIFQIANPANSGKTIKVYKIIVTLYEGGQAFLNMFKNVSRVFNPIFDTGRNLNFGSGDNSVARFYDNNTSAFAFSGPILCAAIHNSVLTEINFPEGIIIYPSDQNLLISITGHNTDIVAGAFTIIWSEE